MTNKLLFFYACLVISNVYFAVDKNFQAVWWLTFGVLSMVMPWVWFFIKFVWKVYKDGKPQST